MIRDTGMTFKVENGRAVFFHNPGNFDIDLSDFPKWEHQNEAEAIDFFEGCLLDNTLFATKRGYVAIYERYLNANSSTNRGYFAPYSDKEKCSALLAQWDDLRKLYEEEYPDEYSAEW